MSITHGLSLWHLRALDAVLREASVSRAATLLGSSQPVVSKVLARLRVHFGDPLLIRVGSSLQPTPKAMQLAAPLRLLIGAIEQLDAAPPRFAPGQSQRTFKVLTTDVGMVKFLPTLIERLEGEGGALHLEAVPLDATRFEMKLESGVADVALGDFPKARAGIKRQHLYTDTYVGIARHTHPRLLSLGSRDAFGRERHIFITASSTGHFTHVGAAAILQSEIPPENVHLRLPSYTAAAIVVSRSDSILILPQQLATRIAGEFGLVQFKPPLTLPAIRIGQYWHERFHRDPAHAWLRSTIRSLFGTRHADAGTIAARKHSAVPGQQTEAQKEE